MSDINHHKGSVLLLPSERLHLDIISDSILSCPCIAMDGRKGVERILQLISIPFQVLQRNRLLRHLLLFHEESKYRPRQSGPVAKYRYILLQFFQPHASQSHTYIYYRLLCRSTQLFVQPYPIYFRYIAGKNYVRVHLLLTTGKTLLPLYLPINSVLN